MALGGAGEGALLVTEQDRFHQIVGDRAAVDRDEGLGLRSLEPWMARATNSLPTPDSPSTSTGMLEAAAFCAVRSTAAMVSLRVMMSANVETCLRGCGGCAAIRP